MTEAKEWEITDINYSNLRQDGSPYLTKAGQPMWVVNLKIAERPDVWINGVVFKEPKEWKGTKQKLTLYVEEYNGKPQPKFKAIAEPRSNPQIEKFDQMIALLQSIDSTLKRIAEAPNE